MANKSIVNYGLVDTTRDLANRVNIGFAKSLRLVSHDCIAYPTGGSPAFTLSKKNMYTFEELKQNSLKELKEIGRQLNVLPAADRRCRQNWIDALVGVNPPLLQLLEVSSAASVVEQFQPIIETVETPSAVEVEPVQTLPIESKFGHIVYPRPAQKPITEAVENSSGVQVDRVSEAIVESDPLALDCPFCGAIHALFTDRDCLDKPVIRCLHCAYCRPKNYPGAIQSLAQESFGSKFGRAFYPWPAQKLIAQAVENSPGVEVDRVFEPIASAAENSPGVKTEAIVSESAIGPAAKNPILTGVTFSDRFLARYAPPQAQIIHFQSDADGQLSLLNFEIESVDEPPDPDDFESFDAFREAIARWDCEHNEVSPEHKEPLQVSLESFCLWVPCPLDWYESAALLEPSSMLELSQTCKSFITSDFFIPIFDAGAIARTFATNRPTQGFLQNYRNQTPPVFPRRLSVKRSPNRNQLQLNCKLNAYQTHTCCIVAGSSTQPARSPPGGDAGF
jgi:hypothetical protein